MLESGNDSPKYTQDIKKLLKGGKIYMYIERFLFKCVSK
jgi:hypothetical protein